MVLLSKFFYHSIPSKEKYKMEKKKVIMFTNILTEESTIFIMRTIVWMVTEFRPAMMEFYIVENSKMINSMAMDIWSIVTTMSMMENGSKAINRDKVSSKMGRMEEFIEQCILKILLQDL